MSEAGTHISATWHFGNVVRPWLSEPECVGLQINRQLLGRQWRCAAVQSGSFLWGGIGHRGCGASRCSCCLRWEYRRARCVCVAAADAWNGTQVAGRASGLRCIFRQVITLLHWFFSLLHWSEKITSKREGGRERGERGREGRGTIDWPSTEIQRLTAEPWVAVLPLSPLIYDWDPCYIEGVLFYKSLQREANSFLSNMCRHPGTNKTKLYLLSDWKCC